MQPVNASSRTKSAMDLVRSWNGMLQVLWRR